MLSGNVGANNHSLILSPRSSYWSLSVCVRYGFTAKGNDYCPYYKAVPVNVLRYSVMLKIHRF